MQPKQRSEIDLFKVAGVQIAIDYSWLIIFVLVLWSLSAGYFPELHPGYPGTEYWMVGLAATLLFFASIVIHELSHAIVANRLGQPVAGFRDMSVRDKTYSHGAEAPVSTPSVLSREQSRIPSSPWRYGFPVPIATIAGKCRPLRRWV